MTIWGVLSGVLYLEPPHTHATARSGASVPACVPGPRPYQGGALAGSFYKPHGPATSVVRFGVRFEVAMQHVSACLSCCLGGWVVDPVHGFVRGVLCSCVCVSACLLTWSDPAKSISIISQYNSSRMIQNLELVWTY